MNQCDGCRAGWPLERGHHRDPSGNHWNDIGCTADRYPLDPRVSDAIDLLVSKGYMVVAP